MFDHEQKLPVARLLFLQYLLLACFLGLGYGLWRLQILEQGAYQLMAEHNRIRSEPIPAPRGRFLDRFGHLIVDNYPSFSALLVPEQTKHLQRDLPRIADGLGMQLSDLQQTLAHFRGAPDYQPIIIKEDITQRDLAFIDAHRDDLPELETMTISRRLYPKNGFAAHVLGYVGEANEDDIRRMHVAPGTLVGKFGLEQYYNKILMGKDGMRQVVVDSRGHVVQEAATVEPVPGHDLQLTLDDNLQIAAEEAMGERPGAVVALNPQNGEVLAMVSRPTFDPNQFTGGISPEAWKKLITNPDNPMMNKAIQAQLAPGSTFKIIMSTAVLETGRGDQKVVCNGGAVFYGRYYKCWISARHQTHGLTDLHKAIAQSCDVFFYTLGNEMGINTIDKYADEAGIGQRTGIDLPHEFAGLMPSPAWKERRFHQEWWKGETISVAIGQGAIEVTPLQLARAVGGIVNGGVYFRPHLVLHPGEVPQPAHQKPLEVSYPLKPSTVSTILGGMRDVVQPGGTAASAELQGVDFGGKTGTAQTISNEKLQQIGMQHKFVDNAWFVGVYPLDHPQLVVVVLYQHGAEGYFAGRIAAQVIKAFVDEQHAAGGAEFAGGASGAAANGQAAARQPQPPHPAGGQGASVAQASGVEPPREVSKARGPNLALAQRQGGGN